MPHATGVADEPVPPRLGRYLVLDVLGKGGMGIVYAAYDPALDRRIALKLLREDDAEDSSAGRVRMHREAQALARLSHPNVVPIHDVGDHGASMYIAMELVQGKTLGDWQRKRPWREVLGAYLSAARGLAAAHDAGLVHRDFKPDNVLVGDDGGVRVTDFGLARLIAPETGAAPAPSPHASPSQLATNVTLAGAVMGTVAYMAPEQIDGEPVDERSDQCSWCIAVWEGIYGEQPFMTAPLAIRSAAMKTDVPKPPVDTKIPRAVGRALIRGMAPAPAERWPNMTALIAELERVTTSKQPLIAAGAVAAVGALALVFLLGRGGRGKLDCDAAGAPIDQTWSPVVRNELSTAFAATGAPFAGDSLAALDRTLGQFRQRWQSVAVDSCRATRVAGTQSEQVLDLRSACLARARSALAIQLSGFAHADKNRIADIAQFQPPDLDECNDVAALQGVLPPQGDAVKRGQVIGRLDDLELELDGRLTLATEQQLVPQADAAIAAANDVGWPVLVARAQSDRARLAADLGAGKDARIHGLAAAAAASRAGDADALVDAYTYLGDNEARLTSDFALGQSWVELASGTLDRLGPRPTKRVAIQLTRGYVAERAGELDTARAAYSEATALAAAIGPHEEVKALMRVGRVENALGQLPGAAEHLGRALELAKREIGPKHPIIGSIEHDLGVTAYRAAKWDESRRYYQEALAVRSAAYGADSVEAANTIDAIANTDLAQDHVADAERGFRQAIALYAARLAPDNPDLLATYNDLGGVLHRTGRYADALANLERINALQVKSLGPDHPDVGYTLVNMAIEAKNLGKWDIVDAAYPHALAIFEKSYGPESDEVATLMINMGEAYRAQGKLDDAEKAYDRARDVIRIRHGADHPYMAHVLNGLGQTELARGHAAAAVPLLEQAVARRERDKTDVTDLAESKFALARALPADARARAVVLATAARDIYKDAGDGYAARLAAVEAWLKQPG